MKQFIAEENFWELFPDAQINLLVVKGIDNHPSEEKEDYFYKLLNEAAKEAKKHLPIEPFSQNPVIDEWRQAFRQFKTKKGARSSIEALLKRANQGREFTPINPLVDLYNSVSLKHAVPCGGEDLEAIAGDLRLGKAEGGEPFFPLGAEEDAPALPEEIIYYDEEGAVCRCWNWREAQRTMLQDHTTEAVLVIEAVNEEQTKRANEAVEELKQLVDSYYGIDSTIYHITKDNPSVELSK